MRQEIVKAKCDICLKRYDIRYCDKMMPLTCFKCVDKFSREMRGARGKKLSQSEDREAVVATQKEKLSRIDPAVIREMEDFYLTQKSLGVRKAKGVRLVMEKFKHRCRVNGQEGKYNLNQNIAHGILTEKNLSKRIK